jgi:hypothetical protein
MGGGTEENVYMRVMCKRGREGREREREGRPGYVVCHMKGITIIRVL